jgi:hypothetical protein
MTMAKVSPRTTSICLSLVLIWHMLKAKKVPRAPKVSISNGMTKEQIAEAQKLSREWVVKHSE